MLLEKGNRLLVAHRRLFEGDLPRFFVGEVEAYEDGIARIGGYSFVRDIGSQDLLRKADRRTKLVALASPAYIVYQIAGDLDVGAARIRWVEGGLRLTEGERVVMNLAELPHHGTI